jgi:hypothetical protein
VSSSLGRKLPLAPRKVEKRALAGFVDEHDGRRRGHGRVACDRAAVDTALLEDAEEKIPQRVRADPAHDDGTHAEAGESARGVDRASACAERDFLDQSQATPRRQLLHGPCDDVGNENPEADDVDHDPGTRTT